MQALFFVRSFSILARARKVSRGLMLGFSFVLAGLVASPVYATCSGQGTTSVSCTGSNSTPFTTLSGGGDVTNTLNNWLSTGYFSTTATNGANTVNVLGSTSITTIISDAPGLLAVSSNHDATVIISDSSGITTSGSGSPAIQSNGNIVTINNGGALITNGGGSSPGIYVPNTANIVNVTNTGTVTAANYHGILIRANRGGQITVTNSGVVTPGGGAYAGVFVADVASSPVSVTNQAGGVINATGAGATNSSHGIYVGPSTGSFSGSVDIINAGSVTAFGRGLYGNTTIGSVSIENSGTVRARGTAAVSAAATGNSPSMTITNQVGGDILGVVGIGAVGSANFVQAKIDNYGTVGASSDKAIDGVGHMATGTLVIDNFDSGTLTGFMTLGPSANTLNNAGLWNLRNFSDTAFASGDMSVETRTALAVAVSNFGTNANNSIDNTGTINLLGTGSVSGIAPNPAGEYLPLGNNNNAMTLNGPIQGQILGVKTFTHSGLIDLTINNDVPGDVLVISGGNTPGANGGGVFVSDGGALKINTVLNDGGANAMSDVLVVDSLDVGAGGSTTLDISYTGTGAVTTGDGILVVEVKDGVPVSGAFHADPITINGFTYELFLGGVNGSNPGNWYLRTPTSKVTVVNIVTGDISGSGYDNTQTFTLVLNCSGYGNWAAHWTSTRIEGATEIFDVPTGATCQLLQDPAPTSLPTLSTTYKWYSHISTPSGAFVVYGDMDAEMAHDIETADTEMLTVTKTVVGDLNGYIPGGKFEITVDCNGNVTTLSLAHGESDTAMTHDREICDITEAEPVVGVTILDGYFNEATISPSHFLVAADMTVEVTNRIVFGDIETALLTVTKTVKGDLTGYDPLAVFEIDISCGNQPTAILKLQAGQSGTVQAEIGSTCTVTEPDSPGAQPGYKYATSFTPREFVVTGDAAIEVENAVVADTATMHTLTVTNKVEGEKDLSGYDLTDKTFTVTLSCDTGQTWTSVMAEGDISAYEVPDGATCSLVTDESQLPMLINNYDWYSHTDDLVNPVVGSQDVTVTHDIQVAGAKAIIVRKAVIDVSGNGYVANGTFDITVDCGTDGSETFPLTNGQTDTMIVPMGSQCTVTEAVPAGTINADHTNSATINPSRFTVGDDMEVIVTNR
ncbi:MAG: DUF5979 domain-containing protein, partial [Burkholderiales bacterium]|nr:DUF5979 domain-containing protein [Burkholderiales bacterium]